VTPSATPPEPPTHHDVAPPEPPTPAEPPRRRSTVREPAPVAFDDGASPLTESGTPVASAPVPAAPEPDKQPPQAEQPQEDAAKPRRTGWWAKRMLGG
jgi:ribonuclease E